MATLCYYLRRFVAIALGLGLTGYSAWASWSHHHDLIGPLAAVSAAGMLIFCEYAVRDRHWVHAGALGVLGLCAAIISASVVLERVSATNEARTHQARSANLPRVEARKALAEAQVTVTAAEAAVRAEAKDGGCGRECRDLKSEAAAARKARDAARAQLVSLGATTAENPAAALLGHHAETLQLAVVLGLPLWLELAAPVVLAYGFAPAPRREPAPKKKAKRRAAKRAAPRKPPAPAAKGARRPPLKLVAANDH